MVGTGKGARDEEWHCRGIRSGGNVLFTFNFFAFFFLLSRVFGILCGIMYSNLTGVVYLFRSGGGRERK